MEVVNSPKMNKLRIDMLTNILNDECKKCHRHDAHQVPSSRKMLNEEFSSFYDECMENTNQITIVDLDLLRNIVDLACRS